MKPLPRFFVPSQELLLEEVFIRSDEIVRHVYNVLRMRAGQEILLLDGEGLCCHVRLENIDHQGLRGKVLMRQEVVDNVFPLTLIQALPKGDKFDLVLQKGTELGVAVFQPVLTERAVPRLTEKRMTQRQKRWQKIVQEAARQSRRNQLPKVRPICSLAEAVNEDHDYMKLAFWESGARPLVEVMPTRPPSGVSLLIGPEGGLRDTEIALARKAGFEAVHLGPRILRTETAALAILPILQYLFGDWIISPGEP